MVSARFGVANAAAQTTNGATRDFSPWAGFGRVKGGIAIGSNATTLGTTNVQNKLSVGVFDEDLNNYAACIKARDNVATTSCHRAADNDRCFMHLDNAGSAVVGDARVSSHITDGVRVTYDDGYPVAVQHFLLCFGGDDLVCEAGSQLIDPALNGTEDIDVGFVPTAIFAVANKTGFAGTGVSNDARIWMGFAADNGSGIDQGGMGWVDENNVGVGTKEVYQLPSNTYILPAIISGSGSASTDGALKVTAFGDNGDGTGYVRIQKLVDDVNHTIAYLILGGASFRVKHQVSPTSTGTQAVSGIGIDPRGMVQISTRTNVTIETIDGPANSAASIGIGGFGPSTVPSVKEGSVGVCSQASASPTSCQCEAKAVGLYTPNHAASDYMEAEVNDGTGSWDSGGWTTDWANVLANANHVWYLALVEDAPLLEATARSSWLARGSLSRTTDMEARAVASRFATGTASRVAGMQAVAYSARTERAAASLVAALSARAISTRVARAEAKRAAAMYAVRTSRVLAVAQARLTQALSARAVWRGVARLSPQQPQRLLATVVFRAAPEATLRVSTVDAAAMLLATKGAADVRLSAADVADIVLLATEAGAQEQS